MIDKKEFFTKLYEKITDAIKQCDEGNEGCSSFRLLEPAEI